MLTSSRPAVDSRPSPSSAPLSAGWTASRPSSELPSGITLLRLSISYLFVLTAVQPSGVSRQPCLLCEDHPASIRFSPCGHTVLCSRCAQRAKRCLQCKVRHPLSLYVCVLLYIQCLSFRLMWNQKLMICNN